MNPNSVSVLKAMHDVSSMEKAIKALPRQLAHLKRLRNELVRTNAHAQSEAERQDSEAAISYADELVESARRAIDSAFPVLGEDHPVQSVADKYISRDGAPV